MTDSETEVTPYKEAIDTVQGLEDEDVRDLLAYTMHITPDMDVLRDLLVAVLSAACEGNMDMKPEEVIKDFFDSTGLFDDREV